MIGTFVGKMFALKGKFQYENQEDNKNGNSRNPPTRFKPIGPDKKHKWDQVRENRKTHNMNKFTGLYQDLDVLSERQSMKPKKKIEQEKNHRESKPQQKTKPESVQTGGFSICSTHNFRISIFA